MRQSLRIMEQVSKEFFSYMGKKKTFKKNPFLKALSGPY